MAGADSPTSSIEAAPPVSSSSWAAQTREQDTARTTTRRTRRNSIMNTYDNGDIVVSAASEQVRIICYDMADLNRAGKGKLS